ncbi:hypothetical protein Fleli_1842 [Bernardetia litoralis DSM 6794]|uniref:Uncharacterized protein n=1 Tax=Bernardetia litoralis (strain ATCC 23117 / DSM 6794 / NBRC 15988 / NCIMB 1366 / Fx l1 / Sio-4) TaxID=880071 RepID=I4AJV5_BERLS|nr:hypothetical protein [Bernardetia litoralis]AFM04240.1 hypothetical protein Fleli_1842 [Bernardetia litoralis DSM 6794]
MKKDFIKNLANDLLRLEVNTIVKDQLLCSKPRSHRWELYDVANAYRELLISYTVSSINPQLGKSNDSEEMRKEFKNLYAGLASFLEIQQFAETKRDEFEQELERIQLTSNQIEALNERVMLCERVVRQSQQMIDIFLELQNESNDPIVSDNEFPTMRLDHLEDLNLSPSQISIIRKANEIGTQRVLLQTVVQVEGDITSYITTRFLNFPEKEQKMIKEVHESSIMTSIQMWQYLFQAVSRLAGTVFTGVTGKQVNTTPTNTVNKPKRIG